MPPPRPSDAITASAAGRHHRGTLSSHQIWAGVSPSQPGPPPGGPTPSRWQLRMRRRLCGQVVECGPRRARFMRLVAPGAWRPFAVPVTGLCSILTGNTGCVVWRELPYPAAVGRVGCSLRLVLLGPAPGFTIHEDVIEATVVGNQGHPVPRATNQTSQPGPAGLFWLNRATEATRLPSGSNPSFPDQTRSATGCTVAIDLIESRLRGTHWFLNAAGDCVPFVK
jgi:hypothetical protein